MVRRFVVVRERGRPADGRLLSIVDGGRAMRSLHKAEQKCQGEQTENPGAGATRED